MRELAIETKVQRTKATPTIRAGSIKRTAEIIGGVILIAGPLAAMVFLTKLFVSETWWAPHLAIIGGVVLTAVLIAGMWLIWGERS